MLSGSLASSLHGEPRATHDIDLVVDIQPADVARVVAALAGPTVYLDEGAAAEAVRRRSMFNLLDTASGDQVDFWLLKDEPFDRERFARRLEVEALGLRLKVSTPEDTILMKLRWAAQAGGSEKQVSDATGVFDFQGEVLDQAYLDSWAETLGVTALLADVRSPVHSGGSDSVSSDQAPAVTVCVAVVRRHHEAGPLLAALAKDGISAEVLATGPRGPAARIAQAALFPQHLASDGPWEVGVAAEDAERARAVLDGLVGTD